MKEVLLRQGDVNITTGTFHAEKGEVLLLKGPPCVRLRFSSELRPYLYIIYLY